MGVKRVVRSLNYISRELLRILDHIEPLLKHFGWRVVSWDFEQGLCFTLAKKRDVLLLELEERNENQDCFNRTKAFNVNCRRPFGVTDELSQEEEMIANAIVASVRKWERHIPEFDRPVVSRKGDVREILVDRMLIPEGRKHYYINPYVGCAIGCTFCYVESRSDLSRRLEGLPMIPWGRYVDVKINAADILKREIRKFPPGAVRMCPIITDPYQPIERHYRISRQCLEVLLEGGFMPIILTRAARVVEDLDILRRFKRACVGFSIPTDEDRCRRIFEPGADPVEERLAALEKCHAAGLITYAVIQPIFPGNVERIVQLVAPFVHAVRCGTMVFDDNMKRLFKEHGMEYAASDAYGEDMERRIREAFKKRGTPLDQVPGLEPFKIL